MLHAKKSGPVSRKYEVTRDGQPFTTLEARSGGHFRLDGADYEIHRKFGGACRLVAADGTVVATAGRPGRRSWRVQAGERELRFRRSSAGFREQTQVDDAGTEIGSVHVGLREITSELSGAAPEVELFVIAMLSMRQRVRRAAITSAASG